MGIDDCPRMALAQLRPVEGREVSVVQNVARPVTGVSTVNEILVRNLVVDARDQDIGAVLIFGIREEPAKVADY